MEQFLKLTEEKFTFDFFKSEVKKVNFSPFVLTVLVNTVDANYHCV